MNHTIAQGNLEDFVATRGQTNLRFRASVAAAETRRPEPWKLQAVATKSESTRLMQAGLLGNALPSWDVPTFRAEVVPHVLQDMTFGLRASRRSLGGSGAYVHWLTPVEVERTVARFEADGTPSDSLCVQKCAPDHRLTLNAEYSEDPIPYLYYSRLRLPMREALRQGGQEARGLAARMILKQVLTESSLADLDALVEQYPGHVIEFSAFEGSLGPIPGRNAVVWEARQY